MLEFLRDYLVYFWNLLFRRNIPPSGALTNAEVDKILAEAKTEKEPIEKPELIKAESVQKEIKVRDSSPIRTAKVTSDNSSEHQKKLESDFLLPSVQTRPIQIRQPASCSTPTVESDEHVLKSSTKLEKASEEKRDSFIEFERLQQSKIEETEKPLIHTELKEEADTIEDEKIESIVEDILDYEENLPDEEGETYIEDDLQKKIREHLKALQDQENQFKHEKSSPARKSIEPTPLQAQNTSETKQLKYAAEEEFENNIEGEKK